MNTALPLLVHSITAVAPQFHNDAINECDGMLKHDLKEAAAPMPWALGDRCFLGGVVQGIGGSRQGRSLV